MSNNNAGLPEFPQSRTEQYLDVIARGGGSGGALPAVTSDDNGDVLTVVNGAWDKAAPSGGGGKFLEVVITRDWDNNTYVPDTAFSVVYDAVYNSEPVSIIILDQGNCVPLYVQEAEDPNKGDEPILRFYVATPGISGTGLSPTMYITVYEWRENDGFDWLATGTVSVTP